MTSATVPGGGAHALWAVREREACREPLIARRDYAQPHRPSVRAGPGCWRVCWSYVGWSVEVAGAAWVPPCRTRQLAAMACA